MPTRVCFPGPNQIKGGASFLCFANVLLQIQVIIKSFINFPATILTFVQSSFLDIDGPRWIYPMHNCHAGQRTEHFYEPNLEELKGNRTVFCCKASTAFVSLKFNI